MMPVADGRATRPLGQIALWQQRDLNARSIAKRPLSDLTDNLMQRGCAFAEHLLKGGRCSRY
jgi:hypothetical protein